MYIGSLITIAFKKYLVGRLSHHQNHQTILFLPECNLIGTLSPPHLKLKTSASHIGNPSPPPKKKMNLGNHPSINPQGVIFAMSWHSEYLGFAYEVEKKHTLHQCGGKKGLTARTHHANLKYKKEIYTNRCKQYQDRFFATKCRAELSHS